MLNDFLAGGALHINPGTLGWVEDLNQSPETVGGMNTEIRFPDYRHLPVSVMFYYLFHKPVYVFF